MKTVKVPDYMECGGVYAWDESLAKAFTFTSRFDEKVEMFLRDGDRMILPRECCPMPEDDRREEGDFVDFDFNFTPRKDQGKVVTDSVDLLTHDVSHILQAPTGYGKTFVGAAIASKIGRRTMVITTKEDIIGQWTVAFMAVCGLQHHEIGVWRGDQTSNGHHKVVVGLVHSVMKGYPRYSPFHYRDFGLVIVDEVHRMGADMFSQAMWYFPAKLRLGLSATPYRKDGKDPVFHGHIGKVRVTTNMETMIPKVIMKKTGWRIPRVTKGNKVVMLPHDYGRTILLEKPMSKDQGRLNTIAKFVQSAVGKDRNTIVFTDTVAHLDAIKGRLLELGIPEGKIGYYVGLQNKVYHGNEEQRKAQREKVKALPVILATYKMVAEATDIPWLDTCVLASPRADVIQIVGRIRREYPDKKEPVVFDMVDSDSPVLRDYAGARLKWYKKLGSTIVHL